MSQPRVTVQLRLQDGVVAIPAALWQRLEGPKPDLSTFIDSDGCSRSPDRWWGLPIVAACVCHDAHYRRRPECDLGGTWAARRRADWLLWRNMGMVVDWYASAGVQPRARWRIALRRWRYWSAVRRYGASSFGWADGEEPLSWWERWRESLLLFRARPQPPAGAVYGA